MSAYRESEKPSVSAYDAWASLWCAQKSVQDLRLLALVPPHPQVHSWLTRTFTDSPQTADAIPLAAIREMEKREEVLWTLEEIDLWFRKNLKP